MKRFIICALATSALAGVPAAAHAEGRASGGFGISVTVPEVCQIEASTLVMQPGDDRVVGSVSEMCNSGRGFRVMASHRTLESGESVEITYAGHAVELDASGMSEVALRSGPTFGDVPISISSSGLAQGIAISLGLAII